MNSICPLKKIIAIFLVALILSLPVSIKFLFAYLVNRSTPIISGEFPLSERWRYHAEGDIAAISRSSDERIIFRTVQTVYAFNAITGQLVWKHPLTSKVDTPSAKILNGTVYIAGNDSSVALEEGSGKIIWKKELPIFSGSPFTAISDQNFYVTILGESIIALDIKTGAPRWRAPTTRGRTSLLLGDQRLYAINKKITAYDEVSGFTLWTRDEYAIDADILDSSIYYVQPLEPGAINIVALNLDSLQKLWTVTERGSSSTTLNATKYGLFVSTGEFLYAYNLRTGEKLWSCPVSSGNTPLQLGDVIYLIGLNRSTLYAIDINTGKELGSLQLRLPFGILASISRLSVGDDELIFSAAETIFVFENPGLRVFK